MPTVTKFISNARARQLFDYDCQTGDLIWKRKRNPHHATKRQQSTVKAFNTRFAGKPAGCLSNTTGYIMVGVDGTIHAAHRLIWSWHNGPTKSQIDHKNTNRTDNRIANLRACSASKNAYNRNVCSRNTSGHKGVVERYRVDGTPYYTAQIMTEGKYKYLGRFNTLEAAAYFRMGVASVQHGEFARHA